MILLATYITLTRGTRLLLLNEYTYSKSGPIRAGGFRYSCSSVHKGCKAHVHVSRDDLILLAATEHNHEPTTYITLTRGTKLLLLNEYTYFKSGYVRAGGSRYSCSSVHKGCKAHLHISKEDVITLAVTEHCHPPSKYIRTKSGLYMKV
ncbi:unnamed protein product [Parnassius mnemosyne]|uniref:FLYWCH-type domain-containing protein n=1 Tax=Parnassius mnemosyne TaxID=213953 RepID=A0AAV1KBM8_9NEOP